WSVVRHCSSGRRLRHVRALLRPDALLLLERVELLHVRLHARIGRIDLGCGLEGTTGLGPCLRIARERCREVDPSARELRIEPDGLAVLGDRLRDLPFELEGVAEVRAERRALRIELDRLAQLRDRTREIALREEGRAEIGARARVVGAEADLDLVLLDRLRDPPAHEEDRPEVAATRGAAGIELLRLRELDERLLALAG